MVNIILKNIFKHVCAWSLFVCEAQRVFLYQVFTKEKQ